MRCQTEVALPPTGQSLDQRLNAIAAALRQSDAVLVRREGDEVSFASCALQLGPNSAVMLGHGRLVITDDGVSARASVAVDLPLADNAFFGGLFSAVLGALVLSTGAGWWLSAGALVASLTAYFAWARRVALDWMIALAQGPAGPEAR